MNKGKALKIAGIISGLLAVVWAVLDWGLTLVFWIKTKVIQSHASIGIIGSADGPTSIYVADLGGGGQVMSWMIRAMPLILAAVSIACFLIRKKILKKGE
ncbi:MAG TPA: hypothetical protein IAC82_04415 [Candidatus Merdivicinus intestinigallinarum]|nr:hypothetical protein [Candidatus Merdivicinus intestinigallinarum]